MAILNSIQFEAVLGNVIRQLDKILYARGSDPKIEKVRRQLKEVHDIVRDEKRGKPSAEQVRGLCEAAESLRNFGFGDDKLENDTFDLEDYVTYRL